MSKLIIVTAPSGAGKTTIVKHLTNTFEELAFSVSATTRARRANEEEGKDYYFIDAARFRSLIEAEAFLEWEEVYKNQYYGTLKSEVERIWQLGQHVIFDIDVQGAVNLKKVYPEKTLTIFVKPPRPEVLEERLRDRQSESEESLRKRIAKAKLELTFEENFDIVLINDALDKALEEAEWIVGKYVLSN
ncbi:MAG: guanylate kinase [Bacteroidota bacterium]